MSTKRNSLKKGVPKKKSASLLAKFNKIAKGLSKNISKIELKASQPKNKFNAALHQMGLGHLEVSNLKFAQRHCVKRAPILDKDGNIIGWKCVKWA